MKIRVSIPGKTAVTDVEDNLARVLFNSFILQMFGIPEIEGENPKTEIPPNSIEEEKQLDIPAKETYVVEDSELYRYKGFLYLRCSVCGKIKGFCSKEETKGYHCFECGADNPFKEELVPLYVNCECGNSFKYMTNMKALDFDINCIECGNPVAVKRNGKKNIYETMRD